VKIDQGFTVTPPPGLEIGYVPVSVCTKLRDKPDDCDVVAGEHLSEPNPLPENYFVTPDWWGSDYGRDAQPCYPTIFSGPTYDVPGTLNLSKRDGSGDKYPYKIPKREEVAYVKGNLTIFRIFVLPLFLHFDSVQFLGWKDSFSLQVEANTQINNSSSRGWERVGNELMGTDVGNL
jgi:hypothetical protein